MPHTITLADKATRVIAVLTVSGLAGLAGWISYHHMLLLARRSGHSGIDAHAFPLTVDGLDLIGVLVLLADRRTGRRSGWLPWTVLGVGAAASVVANIAVAPDNVVARAISGWSAIALLAAAKMLAHLFEPTTTGPTAATATLAPTEASAVAAAPEPTPSTTTPNDGGDVNDDTTDEPPRRARRASDVARRLPTGDAALARWRHIWDATKHLDAATAEAAAEHGVSLRTLQFIRAAGEEGHLDPPRALPAATNDATAALAASPAQLNHHGTVTGAAP
ncbi:DUF2637 domain-containing protein [Micromonospora globbae]|uniref:DUF2637 domain-containing protein n=1 Tax=Micromonospora globbae TaxID=1894969 RepID=UPI0034443BA0